MEGARVGGIEGDGGGEGGERVSGMYSDSEKPAKSPVRKGAAERSQKPRTERCGGPPPRGGPGAPAGTPRESSNIN